MPANKEPGSEAHPTKIRTISLEVFKARCLAIIDQVAATRRPVIITKDGKPIAKLIPIEKDELLVLTKKAKKRIKKKTTRSR